MIPFIRNPLTFLIPFAALVFVFFLKISFWYKALAVVIFIIYNSVLNLIHESKQPSPKDIYENALRSGDKAFALEAGRRYYAGMGYTDSAVELRVANDIALKMKP
jgi:hypothetical protein